MGRGRPKEFDREEALDKAVELFWEKTYGAVGMAELATHMGIGRQSLYDTYGNKEQIFLEALARYMDREIAPMNALLRREGSALANFRELLEVLGARSVSHDRKGCLLVTTMVEHGPMGDEAARLVRDRVLRIEDGFRQTLERAAADGELPGSAEPAQMAALLVATMFGMATLARIGLAAELMPRVAGAFRSQLESPH